MATSSKDRTGLFDGQHFKITPEHGEALKAWLDSGAEVVKITAEQVSNITAKAQEKGVDVAKVCAAYGITKLEDLPADRYLACVTRLENQRK
jgi:hypothetical protein